MPGSGGILIGVDLGGTHLRVARIGRDGAIEQSQRVMTERDGGPEAVVAQIASLAAAVGGSGVGAIGIGVPGTYDGRTGRVLNIPALAGWRDFPLAERVTAATSLACVLENDAKAAALGEWTAGAGRGCDNLAYVTIGTGIGGAMVVDGRLLRGVGGLAGEVGHTRVIEGTEICDCGRTGCWQTIASGPALGQLAQRHLAERPSQAIAGLAGAEPISARHVTAAARAGDLVAREILSRYARALAPGFINVHHCYSPARIVIGGGVAALLDLVGDELNTIVAAELLPGFQLALILPAALGDDAGLVGAAAVARDLRPVS
jgi:glucokinase